MDHIYQQHWIDLPKEIRNHLVKVFGLTANGIAEIRDQTIVSDGFTNKDLEGITTAKMAEYVGSNESFIRLWELTLAKCHYELHPPIEIPGAMIGMHVPDSEILSTDVVIDLTGSNLANTDIQPKFCDNCDSKGGRHLKVCPKYK